MMRATSNRPEVPPFMLEISIAEPSNPFQFKLRTSPASIGAGLTYSVAPLEP